MSTASPPPAPTVRQAQLGDVDDLMTLVRDCIDSMQKAGIDQWDDAYPDRQTLVADIGRGTAYVATHDRTVVGMVVVDEQQEPEYAGVPWQLHGRAAVTHRLMVAPPWQRRGVGRLLARFAERRASALGCDCIRLDAFCANPRALRLYEQAGYRRAGTVRFRKGLFACFEKALRAPQNEKS